MPTEKRLYISFTDAYYYSILFRHFQYFNLNFPNYSINRAVALAGIAATEVDGRLEAATQGEAKNVETLIQEKKD